VNRHNAGAEQRDSDSDSGFRWPEGRVVSTDLHFAVLSLVVGFV
jgi:hypothetical protein